MKTLKNLLKNMTKDELKIKLDAVGVKYDKRLGETKLKELLENYEKNGQNIEENAGEQKSTEVEAKKDDNEDLGFDAEQVQEFKNSVVFGLLGKDEIDIYRVRGNGFIRKYSLEMHGEKWLELAGQFIRGQELKK